MEMRRKDKAMTEEATMTVLKEAEYGFLSTVGEDGYPYGIPVNYVYENGKIYFHGTCFMGHKNQNIAFCNKVCFSIARNTSVVADKFFSKFESVVAFGTIEEIFEEEKMSAMKVLLQKYSGDFMEAGIKYLESAAEKISVFAITVERVTGKAKY